MPKGYLPGALDKTKNGLKEMPAPRVEEPDDFGKAGSFRDETGFSISGGFDKETEKKVF